VFEQRLEVESHGRWGFEKYSMVRRTARIYPAAMYRQPGRR
jgi:hypothetical protein